MLEVAVLYFVTMAWFSRWNKPPGVCRWYKVI